MVPSCFWKGTILKLFDKEIKKICLKQPTLEESDLKLLKQVAGQTEVLEMMFSSQKPEVGFLSIRYKSQSLVCVLKRRGFLYYPVIPEVT